MELNIQGVHFELNDKTREYIEHHLHKIDFAQELIVHIQFTIIKETHEFILEAKTHFRWGVVENIKVKNIDLEAGLPKLFDKLSHKIHKEKEKIQDR